MESLIKQREILFMPMHPDSHQAQTAMMLFADLEGVEAVSLLSPLAFTIHYDIRYLTLSMIHEVLSSVGFHLDNSLLSKLKSALYYYMEEVQRENLGIHDSKLTRDIFINRYQHLPHGCQDNRPTYWRDYL